MSSKYSLLDPRYCLETVTEVKCCYVFDHVLGGNGGRCVGLTTRLPSYVDGLEIWEPQPPGNHRTCPGL